MSVSHDFKATKIAIVRGLYRGLIAKRGHYAYSTKDIGSLAELEYNTAYIVKALDSLAAEKLITVSENNFCSLTEDGILLAEQQLISQAPASDRVVQLNHNTAGVIEIVQGAEYLAKQLRLGNDVGDMTAAEVEVAIKEVEGLIHLINLDTIRPRHLFTVAKETLSWIGEKAAEAVIGTSALALLALIAHLCGIS